MTASGVRRGFVLGLAAAWVAVSAALLAAGGGQWWRYVAPEGSPMTWVQSVDLVLAAAAAALLAVARRAGGDRRGALTWAILAVGFAELAVDERFALHERLRDRVLAPADVGPAVLPWVAPGDVVLLVVAAVGLAFLPRVLGAVRPDRAALRALLLGVALSCAAVLADSVDPARWGVQGERFEQTAEEIVEFAAGLSLLAAAVLPLLVVLVDAAAPGGTTAPAPAAPANEVRIGGDLP